jgi:hypothetical protein
VRFARFELVVLATPATTAQASDQVEEDQEHENTDHWEWHRAQGEKISASERFNCNYRPDVPTVTGIEIRKFCVYQFLTVSRVEPD